jgi:putative methyltransferase (TIGR04325 family)
MGNPGGLLQRALATPPVLALLRWRYRRQFPHWPGAFWGVFGSFAEATAAAPPGLPLGYDSPQMATLYDGRLDRVWATDYPSMLWLERALPQVRSVFDLGGHVGVSYYGFSRYLTFPAGLRWTVCDVPAVIDRGRALAAEKQAAALEFVSRPEDLDGKDVLHASGVLQYLEEDVTALLGRLSAPPAHLLLNKLPLHDGPAFVTLQHTMHAYCPYRVFNRAAFLTALEQAGYRLIDSWDDLDRTCIVPHQPGRAVTKYTGLYLRKAGE